MTETNGSEPQPTRVHLPPLMAQVPAKINVLDLVRNDGVTQIVLLIESANGTFGFPLDCDPARTIGRAMIDTADRIDGGLLKPPQVILGPGGQPLSFGPN